jgi:diaminopimelate epimerase
MDFYKYHGLGNDYIVIDPKEFRIKLTPGKIKLICNRNFGAGSDGILYGPIFKGKKISLKIFNPDGSEAEKSGNGIRIFSRYLVDAGYVKEKKFTLHTLGGEVRVELKKKNASLIRADMGTFTFTSNEIPVSGERREVINESLSTSGAAYKITCVSVGNPHCVIPLDEISEELARTVGPGIENHSLFPNRINVQFMKIIDRNNIRIEIWERGAGYTLASGSSSCAAVCAAYRLGLAERKITVHMPGGILNIEIDQNKHVHMTGTVASVMTGNFTAEMLKTLKKSY